jgi:hypothetical protein
MDQEKMKAAAVLLKRHLFGHARVEDCPGFIGLGDQELHVYVHESKRRYLSLKGGMMPDEWEGFPIRWHFNVGPIVALSAS